MKYQQEGCCVCVCVRIAASRVTSQSGIPLLVLIGCVNLVLDSQLNEVTSWDNWGSVLRAEQ